MIEFLETVFSRKSTRNKYQRLQKRVSPQQSIMLNHHGVWLTEEHLALLENMRPAFLFLRIIVYYMMPGKPVKKQQKRTVSSVLMRKHCINSNQKIQHKKCNQNLFLTRMLVLMPQSSTTYGLLALLCNTSNDGNMAKNKRSDFG